MITDDGRRYLEPCPFCDCEAVHEFDNGEPIIHFYHDDGCFLAGVETMYDCPSAEEAWNRRAERAWHDFSDELPPVGVSVLCRGKNGALYVGKPVTLDGKGTHKVWVPRGDQYRSPEKWMAVSE